ncbi:MAG: exosortase/archaeosortase family protein [Chloroflexi bacterium]|nr:exosortase/archaeosortase family protein [Chloroflexota bacterium]
MPLWVFLFVPAAGWYSLLQLGTFAASDTPLAFVILVPILAGYIFVHDGRAPAASREQSDLFFDGVVFIALFVVCTALLFFMPARLSWYYWLLRLDLLVIPVFATALVVFFWGLGGAGVVRWALLYLLLVWSFPLIWLHQAIAPALVDLTAGFGALVVQGLSLPIAVSASDPTRFVSTGPERFTIVISDTCSGMNALIGFLLIGLPLAITASGRTHNKLAWLMAGALAAFFSNLLRVGILLYLAATDGVDFALGTVHPVLGTVLFAAVFISMLWLARCFGIDLDVGRHMPVLGSQLAVRPDGYRGRLCVAGLAALVLAAGQTTLYQFGPLSSESLPATPVHEAWALLPEIPGWNRELRGEIDWQDLYGRDSQSRLVAYRTDKASVVVQFVATPDKRSLDTYTPEQCNLFHGERIVGVSTVSLGRGIAARLVESQVNRGRKRPHLNVNTLYWYMPLVVGDRLYHARIALLADAEMLPNQPIAPAQPFANPLIQLRDLLDSTLSPYSPAGSTPDFAELDAYTIAFGHQMVEAIVAGSAASSN